MQTEYEIPSWMGVCLEDVLWKGAGHKYIRRVPKPGGGYRYYYNVAGGQGGIGHDSEFEVGAAFRLKHGDKDGHFHIVGKTADGGLRIRHDETGHEQIVDAYVLRAMLHREHAEAIKSHREGLKQKLEQVHRTGTQRQRDRLVTEAAKYGLKHEEQGAKVLAFPERPKSTTTGTPNDPNFRASVHDFLTHKLGISPEKAARVMGAADAQMAAENTTPTKPPPPTTGREGGEFRGSKYQPKRDVKDIAADVRQAVKAMGVKASVTISRFSGGKSIDVEVREAPFPILNPANVKFQAENPHHYTGRWDTPPDARDRYTPEGKALLEKIEAELNSHNRDNSNSMQDYSDVHFYGHAKFGHDLEKRERERILRGEPFTPPEPPKGGTKPRARDGMESRLAESTAGGGVGMSMDALVSASRAPATVGAKRGIELVQQEHDRQQRERAAQRTAERRASAGGFLHGEDPAEREAWRAAGATPGGIEALAHKQMGPILERVLAEHGLTPEHAEAVHVRAKRKAAAGRKLSEAYEHAAMVEAELRGLTPPEPPKGGGRKPDAPRARDAFVGKAPETSSAAAETTVADGHPKHPFAQMVDYHKAMEAAHYRAAEEFRDPEDVSNFRDGAEVHRQAAKAHRSAAQAWQERRSGMALATKAEARAKTSAAESASDQSAIDRRNTAPRPWGDKSWEGAVEDATRAPTRETKPTNQPEMTGMRRSKRGRMPRDEQLALHVEHQAAWDRHTTAEQKAEDSGAPSEVVMAHRRAGRAHYAAMEALRSGQGYEQAAAAARSASTAADGHDSPEPPNGGGRKPDAPRARGAFTGKAPEAAAAPAAGPSASDVRIVDSQTKAGKPAVLATGTPRVDLARFKELVAAGRDSGVWFDGGWKARDRATLETFLDKHGLRGAVSKPAQALGASSFVTKEQLRSEAAKVASPTSGAGVAATPAPGSGPTRVPARLTPREAAALPEHPKTAALMADAEHGLAGQHDASDVDVRAAAESYKGVRGIDWQRAAQQGDEKRAAQLEEFRRLTSQILHLNERFRDRQRAGVFVPGEDDHAGALEAKRTSLMRQMKEDHAFTLLAKQKAPTAAPSRDALHAELAALKSKTAVSDGPNGAKPLHMQTKAEATAAEQAEFKRRQNMPENDWHGLRGGGGKRSKGSSVGGFSRAAWQRLQKTQGRNSPLVALDAISAKESEHKAAIRDALKGGRISRADYERLHQNDYGPVEGVLEHKTAAEQHAEAAAERQRRADAEAAAYARRKADEKARSEAHAAKVAARPPKAAPAQPGARTPFNPEHLSTAAIGSVIHAPDGETVLATKREKGWHDSDGVKIDMKSLAQRMKRTADFENEFGEKRPITMLHGGGGDGAGARLKAPIRLYHITTEEFANRIQAEGFKVGGEKDMGSGVYLTPNPNLVPRSKAGQKLAVLEVEAPGNLLEVADDDHLSAYHALHGRDEGAAQHGKDYTAGKFRTTERPMTEQERWSRVVQPKIEHAGFDGVVDGSRNGNTVIYDPRKLRVLRVLPHGDEHGHPELPAPTGTTAVATPRRRDWFQKAIDLGPPPARNRKQYPFKGTIDFQGLRIRVECPKGTERKGTDGDGNAWSVTMPAHYGEFAATEGTDGDPVDVFVGEDPHAAFAYVVPLRRIGDDGPTDEHDEDKVFVGFTTAEAALSCFRAAYDRKDLRLGPMRRMSMGELRMWLVDKKGARIEGGRRLSKSYPVYATHSTRARARDMIESFL